MPRLILVPDDLEAQARGCACEPPCDCRTVVCKIVRLLDESRARQDARAAKHDADNRALAALIDPCTCGDPDNKRVFHRYNGSPCRHLERVDL